MTASTSVWADYDNIVASNQRNFKIGNINANSIGGLKFCKIKSWLLSAKFDVLVISETKIDASFPDNHFGADLSLLSYSQEDWWGRVNNLRKE